MMKNWRKETRKRESVGILETLELCSEKLPQLVTVPSAGEVAVAADGEEGEINKLKTTSMLRSGAEFRQHFHARVSQTTLYNLDILLVI